MISDEELIREIKNGSKSAMDVLVRRYYKTIFAFVYRRVTDKTIAYDLTQEVFIKIIKNIKRYSKKSSFKNWALAIAVNQCRDYFRSSEAKNSKLSSELEEGKYQSSTSISSVFEKKENRKLIMNALNQLPHNQREVVILKYFDDLKLIEIVGITGANESTVKSRLYQAIGKLESFLERGDLFEQENK
jgi:RNA polymerase sigma factor (sigma-70 family)